MDATEDGLRALRRIVKAERTKADVTLMKVSRRKWPWVAARFLSFLRVLLQHGSAYCADNYRVCHLPGYLGWVDLDLGSSLG